MLVLEGMMNEDLMIVFEALWTVWPEEGVDGAGRIFGYKNDRCDL